MSAGRLFSSIALAAVCLAAQATPAAARPSFDVVRAETACTETKPRPLRQTIVVLDEALVSVAQETNQRWSRMVVDAADARDVANGMLAAGERFTLIIARRDGSELVPIFVGCSPNLTADELTRRKGGDTLTGRFFGGDAESRHKKARSDFSGAVARALAQVQKQAPASAAAAVTQGAFVRALQNGGRLSDPEFGIPRFILLTQFAAAEPADLRDVPSARAAGFALAERSGVDFGRAEIYIAGGTLEGSQLEFARAFLLGARGNLVAVRSDALPRLAPEPASVQVFSGFVDYVGLRVPLQMRFAASATGELVNSWIEATIVKPAATPIEGKAICAAPQRCELQSRERFARAWLVDPHSEPTERGKFPFGAARNLEITIQGATAKGIVSDRNLVFRGEDAATRKPVEMEALRFELQRVDGGQF